MDDLTAEASAPVDRLAGAALAVSKAELGERIQQQSRFEMQADELKARVARVRTHASKAVENSRHASKVRTVRVTGDFIDRLTPQVIAAARALAGKIPASLLSFFDRQEWDFSLKTTRIACKPRMSAMRTYFFLKRKSLSTKVALKNLFIP